MEREITALQYQKHDRNRVNVYLEGEFAFGLAAIEAARLQVGQMLSDDEIINLKKKDEIEKAHERALNFLSYRPRSKAEIRRKLYKKDFEDDVIDIVIERLMRAGLLDDREFARYWVDNRTQFNPRGLRGLRYELRQKGVADDIIDNALATVDVEAAARKAASAGARRLSRYEPREFRRKLKAYLARRGFSYSVIRPLVEEKLEEMQSEENTESEGRRWS